jgi:hypothetical protein
MPVLLAGTLILATASVAFAGWDDGENRSFFNSGSGSTSNPPAAETQAPNPPPAETVAAPAPRRHRIHMVQVRHPRAHVVQARHETGRHGVMHARHTNPTEHQNL